MSQNIKSGMLSFLRKENIVAPIDYNRWRIPPASIAIHLCIGSVYAWSVFNPPLTREFGVVASSAGDWSLSSVVWIFSVAIVCLGLAAALGGKWLERVGPRYVGGIHGRLLTAWSTAGVLGPFAITYLRNVSKNNAISDLVANIDPAAFVQKFGAPIDQLESLVAAKTVTIARFMEIAPAGTSDPTSGLYNTTMYSMAGLLVIAFLANALIRPVAGHHNVEKTHPEAKT
jgi:MFS family permease